MKKSLVSLVLLFNLEQTPVLISQYTEFINNQPCLIKNYDRNKDRQIDFRELYLGFIVNNLIAYDLRPSQYQVDEKFNGEFKLYLDPKMDGFNGNEEELETDKKDILKL